jgi:hypothetical protein
MPKLRIFSKKALGRRGKYMTKCCRCLQRLCLTIAAAVISAPILAQSIPGQADLAYNFALAQWLDDNEEQALPALASLARKGNSAARILLGMVDKHTSLQGPWLALLSKSERIELLRTTGGLSGTSWLRQVEGVPAVQLWLKILDGKADIETALQFVELGEDRLARSGLVSLESRQFTGFTGFADDPRFPIETRYLIWREWQKQGDTQAVSTALDRLEIGDPQRDMLRDGVKSADKRAWFEKTHLAGSLKAMCLDHCSGAVGQCMQAGFEVLGYRRFVSQGTPMASLIPEARFAASKRGQNSVLRRALSHSFMTEARLKPIAAIDACFAGLLAVESQNF